jgi:alkylation response protein AidB-like acyl-CoA dehydrogenase
MPFPYLLTQRQQAIVAKADELAATFAERAVIHDPAGSFPHENYRDLHDAGLLRLAIPRDYGGDEADVFDAVLAHERLGRGDGATALVSGMYHSLFGRLRDDRPWPEPVFEAVCRGIAEHGGAINSCVTEPELGSISRGGQPLTTGTRVEGGWRITGRKTFVTGAPMLRYFLTAVALPPTAEAPLGEMGFAIVQAGLPGLRVEPAWGDNLSLRGCGNDDVIFDNVVIPDGWLVERRPIKPPLQAVQGNGPTFGVNAWTLVVAAVYLGIGQGALEAASDYANGRVPSGLGQPIATQSHIQQWIGEIEVALEAARAVLYQTARAWVEQPDQRPALGPHVAAAKHLVTNTACAVTEKALRVAGGFSLTRSLPLERHFRDARGGLFQPPQDDLALSYIGRTVLAGRPRRQPVAPALGNSGREDAA